MSNIEITRRAEKVAKLVALLPRRFTASKAKAAAVADRMAQFTETERAVWAASAQVNVPSETSWAMAVAAVRTRYPRRFPMMLEVA